MQPGVPTLTQPPRSCTVQLVSHALTPGARFPTKPAPIGAGGMGEVYKARDTRGPHRNIKVLPANRVADEDHRRRFLLRRAFRAELPEHRDAVRVGCSRRADFLVLEASPASNLARSHPRAFL